MIGLLLPRLRTTLLLFSLIAAIPVFAVPTTSHSSDDWTDPDKWEIEHAISSDEGIDNPDFSPFPPPVVQNSSCDNLAGTTPVTFIGTNNQWGQTYIPTVACEGTNNQFESITFEREGNGTAVFTLEIFDGAVLSGTPKYTVTGLQTSQGGGDPTWNLAGGTGDRTFVMGQTYTFLFTKTGGSGVQIHYSPDETSGQAINNGAFDPNIDLRFAVNSSSNAQGTSCDNLAGTTPVTFIGTNNQWGQTYIPTVACEGTNDQFESITFEREGNGTAVFTLEIFDGAVLSGTPKYTVTGLQTSQGGGDPTWDLTSGTGDRSFVIGQTYTFLFTKTGGSGVQIHYSSDETSGQAINNGAFDPNIDLRFAVNSSSSAPAALDFNVDTKTAGPTNTVVIPVWVNNFNGVVNYQGTINFDPAVLTFVQATSPQAAASPMILNSFGTPGQGSIPNSAITFFWYDILSVPQSVTDGTFVIDLEFTVNANATTGFTPITIDGSVTPLGYSDDPNAINLLAPTVMNGGVNIDADPPVTQTVTISSNNALDQTLATVGDVITITFTTDEAPAVPPVVTINGGGNNNVIVTGSGTSWTATKVVQAGDDGLVTFDIELEDQYGNTSNTTATTDNSSVTVDTEGPVITCPPIPALTTDAGQCGAVATFADATATDPSGATVSQIVGAASGTQFPVGTTTLTFEAIDGAGNTSICDVDVVVTDVTGPTVLTQNITVQLDATGNAAIGTGDIDAGSSDPCGIQSYALDINSFDCSDVTGGGSVSTASSLDFDGNNDFVDLPNIPALSNTSEFTIELRMTLKSYQNYAPLFTKRLSSTQTIQVQMSAPILGGADRLAFNVGSGADGFEYTTTPIALNQEYLVSAVYDGSLPESERLKIYVDGVQVGLSNIRNNPATTANLAGAPTYLGREGSAYSNVIMSEVRVWDMARSAGQVLANHATEISSPQSGLVTHYRFNQGSPGGNNPTETTLIDETGGFDGTLTNFALAGSSSNWVGSYTSGGPKTVTLTVTDIHGNSSTGTAQVTVEDNVAPTVLTQDITVALDANGNASITPLDIDNGSNDACGLDGSTPLALDISSFDCSMLGQNTVILTVLDVNGNSNTGTAIVTVVDNTAPTIVCPGDQTIDTDAGLCTATLPDYTGLATVTDNCGSSGSSGSATAPYTLAAGWKHTVAIAVDGTLWTWGEDVNSQLGNGPGDSFQFSPDQISTDTDWIAVTAGNGHSLALKSDGTIWAWGVNVSGQIGNGNTLEQASPVQVGTDNDWIYVAAGQSTSFAIKSNGTLWAWGGNNFGQLGIGNTTNQSSPVQVGSANDWVQVQGALNHSIGLKSDGTIWTWGNNALGQLGTPGNHTSPVQVGSATDWASVEAGQYHSVALKSNGTIWTWGYNADGQLGLGNTTQQNVPNQVGSDTDWALIGIQYSGGYAIKSNGTLWAWGERIYGAIGDGITTGDQLTPLQIGTAANWTSLADGASNYSTLAFQSDGSLFGWGFNNQAQLGLGNATFQPTPVQVPAFTVSQPSSTGGSGANFAVTQSPAVGTALAVGTHTITLSTQDASGNPASCTFQVTVEDNEAPTVLTQDITVQLDATGSATIVSDDIDNNSSDPCGIATKSIDIDNFSCADVGNPVTVTLTVTDVNGNSATNTAVVTVEDNVKPTVVTQDITVQLDASGNASITPAMINNGSSDACGLHPTTPLALDITAFDCSNVGTPVTVTLTVMDVNGNTETGTAIVTVEDNVKPTVVTQDITVTITGDGTVSITPAQIDNGSNDACGLDGTTPLALDISTFDCADVGNPVTVTLTVLDANGNSETGTAVVTVVLAQNASIDGQAITEDNKVIGGVTFDAAGTDGASSQLGTPGYSFLMTPCIGVNDIGAFKNNDANVRNGIDVSDITAMTQHILNIQALGSPYKLLAADVNHNGLINGPDVTQLRQMILVIRDGFPAPGATSSDPNTDDYLWTFIPTDHTWTDNTNPWVYPTRRFFNAPTNSTGEDFYGVKLGDVNNTWDETNPLTGGFMDTLTMLMSDAVVQPGEVFTVPVMLKDFRDISGYQYTLKWDPSVLQLESVENSALFGFFNTENADKGVMSTVWSDMAGQAITESDNTVAFELTFRAVGGWASSSELTITSALTNAIAYNVEGIPMNVVAAPVRIAVGESTTSIDPGEFEGFALLQNVPNPFETSTTFSFSLPRQEEVKIEVYNALGQIVKTFSGTYGVGTHELDWNGVNDAGTEVADGIYYVKMKAGAFNSSISVRKGF